MIKQKTKNPDVIVPILLDSFEECKKKVLWLNEKFGFTKFCPDGLTKGHRSVGYPSRADYEKEAKKYAELRAWMKSRGFSCGWFCNLSIKSGRGDFTPIIKANGTEHPFANCPLDEGFSKRLSSDIAGFAAIARPDFIFLEDDFSIGAANGCFCEHHLAAFAKKTGKRYEREELVGILSDTSEKSLEIIRAYRELVKESLVGMAKQIPSISVLESFALLMPITSPRAFSKAPPLLPWFREVSVRRRRIVTSPLPSALSTSSSNVSRVTVPIADDIPCDSGLPVV